MKGVVCHSSDIQLMGVREELKASNDVVYVPVRALVCQSCGERYYDRRTMRYLEGAESRLKQRQAQLREVGKVLLYT